MHKEALVRQAMSVTRTRRGARVRTIGGVMQAQELALSVLFLETLLTSAISKNRYLKQRSRVKEQFADVTRENTAQPFFVRIEIVNSAMMKVPHVKLM